MKEIARFCAIFIAVAATNLALAQETNYFVVAELPREERRGDSYVLPLTDPEHIQHARELIRRGPEAGRTIVFAKIAAGANGINRNYLAPGAPLWSWHVTQAIGFGDVGAEIYDGNPTLVEEDVQGWIENTNGQIGFWNYTVVAELPFQPEIESIQLSTGKVALGLSGLNPPFVYHIERTSRLGENSWASIDSFRALTTSTNRMVDAEGSQAFFRLRVEQ